MFNEVRVGGRSKAQVLIVGQFKGQSLDKATRDLDPDGSMTLASKRPEATGDVGTAVQAYPSTGYARIIIVGLGNRDSFTSGRLRNAAGAAGRAIGATDLTIADVEIAKAISGGRKRSTIDLAAAGSAFGEGLGLLSWQMTEFKGSFSEQKKFTKLSVKSGDSSFQSGMTRGVALAESANLTRTLSETPPNVATPMWMASQAKKLSRHGVKVTVVKGPKLEAEGLTGIRIVGQASENEPCLIRLEYNPTNAGRSSKPVVLIGKTITYDSGGLSLKINNGMKGMKRDKDGGCAVLGAMHAIATVIKPKRRVVALLAAAENSVSEDAYRPDDVLTFRNGVTVEVTNTDAEGRLVLADALCWACEREDPASIIDMATLTGGVVVALGSVHAGLWCDDDDLRQRIETAAEVSGEAVWRLPHHADYNAMMKSQVADIVNSAPVREAHPIQGAAFLSHFVEAGIPWAHIDIAGVHATDKQRGPVDPGPTGYGARLIAELLDQH